ncbi:hypothetical protein VTL71DRAFT_15604 [Oculimacula yallundae]|uniref:Restriction endonuclease n=1 Tax=Oculimacula yallundae TaxID=86028 RepID=A0ABR4CH28_9HELO
MCLQYVFKYRSCSHYSEAFVSECSDESICGSENDAPREVDLREAIGEASAFPDFCPVCLLRDEGNFEFRGNFESKLNAAARVSIGQQYHFRNFGIRFPLIAIVWKRAAADDSINARRANYFVSNDGIEEILRAQQPLPPWLKQILGITEATVKSDTILLKYLGLEAFMSFQGARTFGEEDFLAQLDQTR